MSKDYPKNFVQDDSWSCIWEGGNLFENVQDLIFVLNDQGEIIFVNQRMVSLTGKSKDDWMGKDFLGLLVPEDIPIAQENFAEARCGTAKTFEMRVVCTDGVVYFSTNMNPIFEDGQVVRVVAIARDISDRKKLEQEIIELKNFNESIIQSMQAGLITLDLDQVITSLNMGAEEVLGFTAVEVIGRPIRKVLSSKEVQSLLAEQSQSSEILPNREMIVTTKTGEPVHIGFTVTPRLNDQGQRVGTIISFKDISQIKSMQVEMIRMDRLASMGVLAAGLAHEIKNPLAGIKTMAQTLEEDLERDDSRREYLARIIRQVNRLDDMLKAFSLYARPRPPVRKHYKLQQVVHEMEDLVKKKLAEKEIVFMQSFEPNLPEVFVDADQIQQVFINLMLNAIDAVEAKGKIVLNARALTTSLRVVERRGAAFPRRQKEALFVETQLHDTGIGIEQHDLKKIFDPFFTTKPQGTGLGLSMVYRIVAANGGEIRAGSTPGEGTTFTLLLPTEE